LICLGGRLSSRVKIRLHAKTQLPRLPQSGGGFLSSGADIISDNLLKEIEPIIITPLHYFINLSLETGFIPEEFKVVPVFKDGDKKRL
jgi:hypothetical protein